MRGSALSRFWSQGMCVGGGRSTCFAERDARRQITRKECSGCSVSAAEVKSSCHCEPPPVIASEARQSPDGGSGLEIAAGYALAMTGGGSMTEGSVMIYRHSGGDFISCGDPAWDGR